MADEKALTIDGTVVARVSDSDVLLVGSGIKSNTGGALGLGAAGTGVTPEGGFFITVLNDTGETSVKGKVVRASTGTNFAVSLAAPGDADPIGVVYDAGIGVGSPMRVVVGGWADVLVDAGATIQRNYWVAAPATGGTAGRANCTTSPPTQTVHFQEIGHVFETKANDGNTLARCILHFN